jgi:tryptophanyl-tRNA synthetase
MRIFSGIQPTGAKHLGNYIGAIRNYVSLQDEGEAFFCIVDLHSITTAYEPEELHEATLSLAALLFAAGIDPDRATLFVQSHVHAHPEAAWLLGSVTSFGELRRMTQFKEKAEQQEFVSAALFTYPVLQAADILLYQTDLVPVGEDQRQHLELARDVAARFNARYGETFRLPDAMIPKVGGRVMDLQEPTKKMSTTGGTPQGTVGVLDPPDTIRKKFRSAVTDSGTDVRHDPDEKAGVSNLIEILSIMTGEGIPAIEARYDGGGYGAFKADVAEAVVSVLGPIRERYDELRGDEAQLQALLVRGAAHARAVADPTLEQMYERMGFAPAVARPPDDRPVTSG